MATTVPSGTGPSTAELAAEMPTQMSAQGFVAQQHQAQATPADTIVKGIPTTQPNLGNVVALMTDEQLPPSLPSLSMPIVMIGPKTKAKLHAKNWSILGRC